MDAWGNGGMGEWGIGGLGKLHDCMDAVGFIILGIANCVFFIFSSSISHLFI
jgi:hypothetical protein